MVCGMALAWQQMSAILIKRFHHSRRDWKGLISQILLPVLFVVFAMGLSVIKNDLQHYPELELSPALYNVAPSYSFFRSVPIAKQRSGGRGEKSYKRGLSGGFHTKHVWSSSINMLKHCFLISVYMTNRLRHLKNVAKTC